ncbi:MAG TPA: ribosome maturation factor RimM [Burkholderiales bacterium]|nr:ribosome maturation factor RimM [Burkholderiales bacterium]
MAAPTRLVVMGRVLAPWGVKGAVKIERFGANLWKYSHWWVGRPGKHERIAVAECREQSGYLIARFEGCTSPEQAKEYGGFEVALERDELPQTGEHEFYQADVIGFEVVNQKGEHLGRVKEFFSAGAHDVMRVEHQGGERLLPVAGDVIRKVDLRAGRVEVEWGADW